MKKDILNETFQKHTFLLKKRLYEQGVIQQQPIQEVELEEGLKDIALASLLIVYLQSVLCKPLFFQKK